MARELNEEPPLTSFVYIPSMASWAATMVNDSLDSFVEADTDLAIKVCRNIAYIAELNKMLQVKMLKIMIEDTDALPRAIKINYVSKALERIAAHAVNIAEMVVFMVKGKDIRHTSDFASF
jgi:phosphate transport system protein